MKKIITLLVLLLSTSPIFSHYLWIEAAPQGQLNQEHQIKVRFGEYTYGVIEKVQGDAFKGVSNFSLWLIAPDGTKTTLPISAKDDFYAASFTPNQKGTYTLALDNKDMKVLDFTQYDFGIFKPQYHAKAKVVVDKKPAAIAKTNVDGIEIIDVSPDPFGVSKEVSLQLLFKGKPLAENEVSIFVSDLWSKKLSTDQDGKISFQLPWPTKYTVEATYNETVPGTYKGLDYEFIWHCATYCIPLKKQ
ncbi:DUF4198 domain-containing protein [Zobellia galactanivorans]|uniref:DUF4198 domain-containing protein n=1 Tax=Zobellia galactanivorans (strain DSM 12802 / CCUG 47099 / CIP 106680 / NCIMB 13871 / Dsij) TaxID=63186 RepID=UPI001C06E561|nr:DUF4198 domain-containing protein [Zobellia galactanivorans]MBU3027892.1 DUF4198 domain-containing protein [Zobellia galactanivorans]MDO6810790.1 DUF4198 domain-containing protein [Zobellia galactanivorans]